MRRSPVWAKLTIAFGAVLLLTAGAAFAAARYVVHTASAAVTQVDLLGGTQKKPAGKSWFIGTSRLKGPIDLLLMGVDARARWAVDDLRADTIIVLHIPAGLDRAYLVSIPRDTEMRYPAFAKAKYPGGVGKVNEAFFHGAQNGGGWTGGAQLLAETIKLNTGMSFDGAAIIDFNGFKSVIDALHGVRLCVDQRVRSHHLVYVDGKPLYLADARRTGKPTRPIWYDIGCRTMVGWQALDYSRQRYGLRNGDYDRQRHQQQLIKAIAQKAASHGILTNPAKATKLIKAAGKAFVLDTGGVPLTDFVFGLRSVGAKDLVLLRTNNGTFAGNGAGRETITRESRAMFTAVQSDRLGDFLVSHPDVIVGKN
jgi:LCP family protein required for cell wall assembly